jgi:tetratricopeptide (TPR) repeat protein
LELHRAVGDEEGLAVTYSQLGKTFLEAGKRGQAEKCLNNASEHFIKLGNEPAEAAVLRLLANLYVQAVNKESAIRCLERVVLLDARYGLSQHTDDMANLKRLAEGNL